MSDPVEQIRAALEDAETALGRLEDALEDAHDEGYRQGEEHGLKAGEQDVNRFVRDLLHVVDQMRRRATLPLPLHSGIMTLDEIEKMIRKIAGEMR